MFTIDGCSCPQLGCTDCIYNGEECKRIGGTNIEFETSMWTGQPYSSYPPCNSFQPKYPDHPGLKGRTNFDDFWNAYKDFWWNRSEECAFIINGDNSIRYYVPLEKFIDGTMIKDGKLLATHKGYYEKIDGGIGYKLVKEEIDGVEIET